LTASPSSDSPQFMLKLSLFVVLILGIAPHSYAAGKTKNTAQCNRLLKKFNGVLSWRLDEALKSAGGKDLITAYLLFPRTPTYEEVTIPKKSFLDMLESFKDGEKTLLWAGTKDDSAPLEAWYEAYFPTGLYQKLEKADPNKKLSLNFNFTRTEDFNEFKVFFDTNHFDGQLAGSISGSPKRMFVVLNYMLTILRRHSTSTITVTIPASTSIQWMIAADGREGIKPEMLNVVAQVYRISDTQEAKRLKLERELEKTGVKHIIYRDEDRRYFSARLENADYDQVLQIAKKDPKHLLIGVGVNVSFSKSILHALEAQIISGGLGLTLLTPVKSSGSAFGVLTDISQFEKIKQLKGIESLELNLIQKMLRL
jgi:hypothetical protein